MQFTVTQPPWCTGAVPLQVDLAWSPDDRWLCTVSMDNTCRIWDMGGALAPLPREAAVLQGHTSLVKGVAWDPIGSYLVTQSDDKSVIVWHVGTWKIARRITGLFSKTVRILRTVKREYCTGTVKAVLENSEKPLYGSLCFHIQRYHYTVLVVAYCTVLVLLYSTVVLLGRWRTPLDLYGESTAQVLCRAVQYGAVLENGETPLEV